MPRPKRAKVASTTRVAKVAPRKQQPTKATKTGTIEISEPMDDDSDGIVVNATKKNTNAIFEPVASFSNDSDGLVVKATRLRKRMPWQPEPQKDADFTMTGALPTKDGVVRSSSKTRTPLPNASRRTRASKGSAVEKSTRRTSASSVTRQSHSARTHLRDVPPAQEEDSSGFGDHLLSFTSLDSDSPAHGTRPPSAIKFGATPAHETSILALTNFKRRPRQHSLLRQVQQTTDVDGDNDSDDFDFDDFLPDAESTPFHMQKGMSGEPAGNDSGVHLSSSGSRGAKRKLSPVVQVPRSSPPYESEPDVGGSRSSSPSLPDIVPSMEEAQAEPRGAPEALSETMAPPMSSSAYDIDEMEDPPESPVGRRQRGTRGKSAHAAKDADSEGEETDRPRTAKGRQKSKVGQGISTAKLQALLPRRRTRMPQEDEFDIPSGDSDQDELALPQRRQTAAARKSMVSKANKKPARAAKKIALKPKPAAKNARTYGRRPSSDKENEGGREDSDSSSEAEITDTIEVTNVKPSKALEAIAKKFEEVDEFELDFESVSYVTTSSPYR